MKNKQWTISQLTMGMHWAVYQVKFDRLSDFTGYLQNMHLNPELCEWKTHKNWVSDLSQERQTKAPYKQKQVDSNQIKTSKFWQKQTR